MIRSQIASFESLTNAGEVSAAKNAVVLFHGFGADNNDLASLAEVVDPTHQRLWYFPNGPHKVEIGPHMTGRAWFPLRLAELEKRGVDFTQVTPDGMEKAVEQGIKAIDAIRTKHGLEWNQIVIGGFSQGAMVALDIAMRLPGKLAGVTLFSGSLVNEPGLRKLAAEKSGLKFFQSHGTHDMMLPYDLAERLDVLLNECGLDGMLYAFRGGHEIPMPVLREWTSWLADTFK